MIPKSARMCLCGRWFIVIDDMRVHISLTTPDRDHEILEWAEKPAYVFREQKV